QGTCITNYHFDKERFPVDYYVLTRRGRARFKPEKHAVTPEPDLVDAYLYYDAKPVWQMFIHNRAENYIRIVRGK
ncbi:MAG TPA: hypothetical protein VJH89_01475, partial [Patescibacteria group bacterium]|nr:hypothetical protein [Patescibacteria group bacterium]